MRAPVRFALVVAFALAVLAGFAVDAIVGRARKAGLVAAALIAVTLAEHYIVFGYPGAPIPEASAAYGVLARQPAGPVIELPFFERPRFFPRHAKYMLMSTAHWMPLVNGYSDYVPPDFQPNAIALAPFPFPRAFDTAGALGVPLLIRGPSSDDAIPAVGSRRPHVSCGLPRPAHPLADTRPSLLCAPHMNTRYAALQENQQISCHKTL